MRYSYEYKRMCVELYQQEKWPETPTGISEHIFRVTIQKWACMDPFAAGRISDFSGWFCGAIRFFLFRSHFFCFLLTMPRQWSRIVLQKRIAKEEF